MQNVNSLKMSIIGGIHAVHYFRGKEVAWNISELHLFDAISHEALVAD